MLEEYLDGPEVDVDLILSEGEAVYGAITDNWPTVEPYFNETGSNCPSILPTKQQQELMEMAVQATHCLGFKQVCCVHCTWPKCRMPRFLPTCVPSVRCRSALQAAKLACLHKEEVETMSHVQRTCSKALASPQDRRCTQSHVSSMTCMPPHHAHRVNTTWCSLWDSLPEQGSLCSGALQLLLHARHVCTCLCCSSIPPQTRISFGRVVSLDMRLSKWCIGGLPC